MEKARAYAHQHGLNPDDPKVQRGSAALGVPAKPAKLSEELSEERAYLAMQMLPEVVEVSQQLLENPAPAPLLSIEERARAENRVRDTYKYPDFIPPREPLPSGVDYAVVCGEYGNPLMKKIQFDNGMRSVLHVTRKVAQHCLHETFPVTENPDERQGGFVIWNRK